MLMDVCVDYIIVNRDRGEFLLFLGVLNESIGWDGSIICNLVVFVSIFV